MKSDPASRRARNVVLLVIVTVALPSLVLTALGVAAIRNEEVATKRRIVRLYKPTLIEVAKDFNRRLDRILIDAEPALMNLLEWSRDPSQDLGTYRYFVEHTPGATNYFILDDESNVVAPQFDDVDPGSKCCAVPSCFDVHDLSAHRRRPSCSPSLRQQQVTQLFDADCQSENPSDGETHALARDLLQKPLLLGHPHEAIFIDQVVMLTARLADPTRDLDPTWSQKVATALMFRFEALEPDGRRWAAGILAAQSQRKALLKGLSRLVRPKGDDVMVIGFEVDEIRRVVILLNRGDRTAGFELVSTPLEREINEVLIDLNLGDRLAAHVGPFTRSKWWNGFLYPELMKMDKHEVEDRLVTWFLSNRTNLNWAFELVLLEPGLQPALGRSRYGLYLWSLILVASALLGGIIYTVRSVVQEARLSRLKTDFVSSVSHDLRTPLTSIRMFSETLRAGRYESDEERHEFLQIIIEESERLSRLTERILDFSRMEAGKKSYRKSPTDISCLAQHALKAMQPAIDAASFEVDVQVQDGLPRVPVDRDAMVEVLINLYSNAIKYSPESNWMGVLITGDGHEVRIAVRDTGIGIRKVDHQRIFEKFFRVDNRRASEVGGSGIGLSLVKHIVDNHGGAIEVDSTPGRGSTFTIRLPIDPNTTVDCSHRLKGGTHGQCADRRG